jgi:beta-1,4-N-acetylglucosaminyltransferase
MVRVPSVSLKKDKSNRLRVCLAASSGGHISQLLKLADCWNRKKYDTFFVTTTQVIGEKLQRYGRIYFVGESNREHPLLVLRAFLKCALIVSRERPDVLISTGAATGCIACLIGKLLGANVVWVDSITNIERISLSGRIIRHVADLFLVQWPKLAEKYKNVEYIGTIV